MVREISFSIEGYPPAKNEAKSMLAAGHLYADRVRTLLQVVCDALAGAPQPLFPTEPLGFDLVVVAPADPPADATNYLGGGADVLEEKGRRGPLYHLADLAAVALYGNDRQIQE